MIRTLFLTLMLLPALGPQAAASTRASIEVGNGQIAINDPVRIDAHRAFALHPGQSMAVRLPVIGRKTLILDQIVASTGQRLWLGHFQYLPDAKVALTFDGVQFSGQIQFQGLHYAVQRQDVPDVRVHEIAAATREVAQGVYAVNPDINRLASSSPGDVLSIRLPDGAQYDAVFDHFRFGENSTTWVGHNAFLGDPFRAMVTYSGSTVFGRFVSGGHEYEMTTVNGQTTLTDITRAGLVRPQGEDTAELPSAADQVGATAQAGTTATTAAAPAATTGGTSSGPVVDVMVLYGESLLARYGSAAAVTTRIDYLFSLSNQAYVDSGINLSIRLVKLLPVASSFNDEIASATLLPQLQSSSVAALSTVSATRDAVGADIVMLVRSLDMNFQSDCGLAYLSGGGGNNVANYAAYAYGVVGDGKDITGKGYYCNDYSFPHELGHVMGAAHDRATVAAQHGGPGAYAYSYGYGISGTFGTIMSYITPVIGQFSNPNLSVCAKHACGVADTSAQSADNAHTLNNTAAAVAAFRPTGGVSTPPTPPKSLSLQLTLTKPAGVSNLLTAIPDLGFAFTQSYTPPGTQASCSWSPLTGVVLCSIPQTWAGSLCPVSATGYASFATSGGAKCFTTSNFAASVAVTFTTTLLKK